MNRAILMGRLVRDPEVRYATTRDGQSMAVARYTVAVDRRGQKDKDGKSVADFIRCVAFGKRGEFAEKYFKQGQRVLVSGSIQTGSYQDKDGQTVYTTDIVIEDQEFADSRGSGTGDAQGSSGGYQESAIGDGFMNIPDGVEDEGLPFN